ncbi:hypothetical protein VTI28DRAFT_3561 [Corynascus sepedonium]
MNDYPEREPPAISLFYHPQTFEKRKSKNKPIRLSVASSFFLRRPFIVCRDSTCQYPSQPNTLCDSANAHTHHLHLPVFSFALARPVCRAPTSPLPHRQHLNLELQRRGGLCCTRGVGKAQNRGQRRSSQLTLHCVDPPPPPPVVFSFSSFQDSKRFRSQGLIVH